MDYQKPMQQILIYMSTINSDLSKSTVVSNYECSSEKLTENSNNAAGEITAKAYLEMRAILRSCWKRMLTHLLLDLQ